ncbi:MAG: hypothetical protein K2X94_03885 [Amoebophilaceae bacterium]|nr:hypothetical protein [Amoebophilaceae bacterium]
MQFAAIPGHDGFKKLLLRTASTKKVAHAQLFSGPVGAPTLAFALAFATYLNCIDPTSDDACGRCLSCTSMQQLTHPDLQLVFPSKSSVSNKTAAASFDVKAIALFRERLQKNPFMTLEEWARMSDYDSKQSQITRNEATKIIQRLSLKAVVGPYKVVIIWLPECLNPAAANALLKTLEEPSAATVFLLASVDSQKILPTIRSRTQQHQVALFAEAAIQQLLRDRYVAIPDSRLAEIAFLAQGDVSKAFQLAEEGEGNHFEWFSQWMRNCYKANYVALMAESETFHQRSMDGQKMALTYALQLLRMTLLSKFHPPLAVASPMEVAFSQKFGLTVTFAQLKQMIALLGSAYAALARNGNGKMVYLHTSIQAAGVFKD